MRRFAVFAALGVALASVVAQPAGAAKGLRDVAERHDLLVGSEVTFYYRLRDSGEIVSPIRDDQVYRSILIREFATATPGNVMKMEAIHPQPEEYSFFDADELVAFGEQFGLAVRGHTLIWDQQMPPWFRDGKWNRRQTREILESHIATVAGRYAGRLRAWDVVNEAVDDQGKLRKTIWSKAGKDYIERAFLAARAADPDALLCYNDFNHEDRGNWQGAKAEGVFKLVQRLVQKGVPIDCVGFQFHIGLDFDPDDIASNFQRYADLGIQVHITELDVRIEEPITSNDLREQAGIYREVLELCLAAENCTDFVVWGFTDRYSWIPYFLEGWGGATPFDDDYKKKPAYKALFTTLKKAP